jgi:hypothetical protein
MRGAEMASYVNNLGMVIYEQELGDTNPSYDALAFENAPEDSDVEFGVLTDYGSGPYPNAPVVYYHERDAANSENLYPTGYVTSEQVANPYGQFNPGGQAGLVNRMPFTQNGIADWEDHNLRGAAPHIPKRVVYGSYGDVGNTDSYSAFYAQAIAQGAEQQMTREEQWALMSGAV